MPKKEQGPKLVWVTVAGNRYDVPAELTETLETEPFEIDTSLGEGHLEFDGEAIGPVFLPQTGKLITVNLRAILLAKGRINPLGVLPPPDDDEAE